MLAKILIKNFWPLVGVLMIACMVCFPFVLIWGLKDALICLAAALILLCWIIVAVYLILNGRD